MKPSLRLVFCCLAVSSVAGNIIQMKEVEEETEKPRQIEIVPNLGENKQDLKTKTDDETEKPRQIQIFPNLAENLIEENKPTNAISRAALAQCNGAAVSLVGSTLTNAVLVQSTNYPNNYIDNQRCVYSLSVPANVRLNIDIPALEIECPYDVLTFAFNSNPPALTLCSAGNYYIGPQSSAYIFKVKFVTDYSVVYSGFRMNFYLDSASPATTTTTPATTTTTPAPPPPGSCSCGRFGFRADQEDWTRIVGGAIAAENSIPYQIGLWTRTSSNPFCGGTVISPNFVLTAAHCTRGFSAAQLRVTVGDLKFTVRGDGETFLNVTAIINHPSYNSNSQDNDFALLRLSAPAVASAKVGYACLPTDTTQTFAGTTMKISGWGTTSFSGSQSSDLLFAYVDGVTNAVCNSAYGGITANMICATGSNFTKDTCQGDSGGPLVASVNGKITLVGVTSWGDGCAKSPFPGVYARVTAQKSWILANSDAGTCQN